MADGAGSLTVQGIWLDAYVDNNPLHDPSRVSDAQIQATQDYAEFTGFSIAPMTVPLATTAEALLACRLFLRDLRAGKSRIPYAPEYLARYYIGRAKEQLGTLAAAQQLVGHLNWVPFNTQAAVQDPTQLPTEFGRWILAGGPEPSALSGSVNCWEMVLFGAYRAGYLSRARITAIYTRAVAEVRAGRASLVGTTVESSLRAGAGENVYDPTNPDTPRPLAGDLVIFQTAAGHVAISVGTQTSGGQHQVLSLWSMPGRNFQVQQTTVEALLAAGASRPVKFWSPTW